VTQRPQFFINMEIERYTLATGETALTGFSRYWRHWGLFFAVLTFLANAWPGWITSSATMVTFFFDGGGNVKLLAILGLASIAIALTPHPGGLHGGPAGRVLQGRAGHPLHGRGRRVRGHRRGLGRPARRGHQLRPHPRGPALALVLPALAFAGAGGGQNLLQSNWMRDKGYGMGVHVPHLASPVTGAPEAAPGTGYTFRENEENLARRRAGGMWPTRSSWSASWPSRSSPSS
jgi:hypothetical protein